MRCLVSVVLLLFCAGLAGSNPALAATPAAVGPKADAPLFERDVRPILKEHCFGCHGEAGKREGGLDVRLRRFLAAGGDSGPAILAAKPAESPIVARVAAGEMPPEEIKHRPTPLQMATLERWIAAGALTARPEPEKLDDGVWITEEDRSFWAFQPVRRPPLPKVAEPELAGTAIDRFVSARLQAAGLSFSPPAERRTLVRRVYYDLVGLPPPPAVVEAFVADGAPDAWSRLVERLLAAPEYGERWGRHWLDVAGYADSEGYNDNDAIRPDAYKYRDYVIRSLNADKPYGEFVREQLAGDELLAPPYRELSPRETDRLVATGLLRMAPDGTGSGNNDAAARNAVVADTIEIVSTAVLGMTVACAQCHDHRYDPIPQRDYYQLRAIFDPAFDWKAWRTPSQRRISLYTDAQRAQAAKIEAQAKAIEQQRDQKQAEYIEAVFERELAKLPEDQREAARAARDAPEKKRTAEQKDLLRKHPSLNVTSKSLYLYDRKAADDLKSYASRATAVRKKKPREEFVRAAWEPAGATPQPSHLFVRGDHEQPQQQVHPAALSVLDSQAPEITDNDPSLATSGRRLAYANWLASGKHPLVARVIVNRVWGHHFGRGIVTTPGDFGMLGARPSHPLLLDWLADEFVRRGMSLKQLHRLILNSAVYQQQSRRHEAGQRRDAENKLLWRMPVRRLEAEVVRDAVLATSGKLNAKRYGKPVPVMADEVGQFVIGIENLNAGRPGARIPLRGEEFRRSVYVQVRRSRPLAVLDTFDAPAMAPNCTSRPSSTVASQSLLLMNSTFTIAQAEAFARRVESQAPGDLPAQLETAWQLALARSPGPDERAAAVQFVAGLVEHYLANPLPIAKPAPAVAKQTKDKAEPDPAAARRQADFLALAAFCQALLTCNEFIYID